VVLKHLVNTVLLLLMNVALLNAVLLLLVNVALVLLVK
jgi:hypothetical protein